MFKNLSIKARLIFILAFLSALLLMVGIIGLSGMSKTEAGLKTVYEDRTVPLMDLGPDHRYGQPYSDQRGD